MTVDDNNKAYDERQSDFIYNGSYYNLTLDSFEEIWNSPFYKDMRKKMVVGEPISNCAYCYDMEKNGLWSKRMGRNLHFLGNPEGDYETNPSPEPLHQKTSQLIRNCIQSEYVATETPQWLELRFSTICNLRCVMCSPSLSTSLYEEYDSNQSLLSDRQKGSLKIASKIAETGQVRDSDFFMQEIRKISTKGLFFEFRGGEILQDKKMLKFMEELSTEERAPQMMLDITTNGIGLNQDHIKILSRFKGGKLKISVDAFERENELIRYPSKWKMTVNALKQFKGLHKGWVPYVQPTLSAFQAPTIDRLLLFLEKFSLEEGIDLRVNVTKVRGFEHLMLNLVPLEDRVAAAESAMAIAQKSFLCAPDAIYGNKNRESIIGLSQALREPQIKDAKSLRNLFAHVDSLSAIRKINYYDTFPHLARMKKEFEEILLQEQDSARY